MSLPAGRGRPCCRLLIAAVHDRPNEVSVAGWWISIRRSYIALRLQMTATFLLYVNLLFLPDRHASEAVNMTKTDASPGAMREKAAGSKDLTLPVVSVRIWVDPPVYSLSNAEPPLLNIAVTSHASRPITVLTWHKILHVEPPGGRVFTSRTLEIFDLDAQRRMWHRHFQPLRPPFMRLLGDADDKNFTTLHPEVPVLRSWSLIQARSWVRKGPDDPVTYTPKNGPRNKEEHLRYLEPGHKFQIRFVDGRAAFGWWAWGSKQDVLEPAGTQPSAAYLELSEQPSIELVYEDLAEFEIIP